MKTKNTTETQALPVEISEEVWWSIHSFLKTLPNVYVGNPEAWRRFLSAIVRAHTSAAGAPKKTEVKKMKPSVAAAAVLRRNSMLR